MSAIGAASDRPVVFEHNTAEYVANSSLARLQVPSQTVLVYETLNANIPFPDWVGQLDGASNSYCPSNSTANLNAAFWWAGHLATSNYLFAVGHVKAMRFTGTYSPQNMWTIRDDSATMLAGT